MILIEQLEHLKTDSIMLINRNNEVLVDYEGKDIIRACGGYYNSIVDYIKPLDNSIEITLK